MEPTLVHGQGLVGVRSSRAAAGQLRCFEHPHRPGFWMVKRVHSVVADNGASEATMDMLSDNTSVPTVDSRHFGPVRVEGSYRVIVRIPRRWM
ncbi:MAG: S26 family signal peptidase [Ilumatobacter sp.]